VVLNPEDGTDKLSRNVGKKFPLNLMFMGLCIVNIFQHISNKMQRYTVCLYLETAVHVSGSTSTHHQERTQLYLQHLVFVTPLLLSAASEQDQNVIS
jgi:hypothetical protein